jgi:hypothetical protein
MAKATVSCTNVKRSRIMKNLGTVSINDGENIRCEYMGTKF